MAFWAICEQVIPPVTRVSIWLSGPIVIDTFAILAKSVKKWSQKWFLGGAVVRTKPDIVFLDLFLDHFETSFLGVPPVFCRYNWQKGAPELTPKVPFFWKTGGGC